MDRQQLNAAALLAQRWQWHEQAIRTALRGDGWNDLELRFPVAHGETFEQLAGELAVAPPWLLAVARQESRSEEHTSELQSRGHLVCRLLLAKKNIETLR